MIETLQRRLLLVFVAYHPSADEVACLRQCLEKLPSQIGYALAVNDYISGEPIADLAPGADHVMLNSDNPGYGRAVNRLVRSLTIEPSFLGVLNTDLCWEEGMFSHLLRMMESSDDLVLAVPQIVDPSGEPQQLCKRNPTVLALLSRRFVPRWLKPMWLRRYDRWFVMADHDQNQPIESTYLSGCCMVIRSDAFRHIGGFDERFFLYLEDADLTRSLAAVGRCLHLPDVSVTHGWGRGNYRSLRLMFVNFVSAWIYFRKWGWALW